MTRLFDLQGHRGARGLKPENTLPSFEVAFDLGVTTVETDLHLTRDGVPVIFHDERVTARLCRRPPGRPAPDPAERPLVSSLTLDELRCYHADVNPAPARFPAQDASVTPVAHLYAERHGIDSYTPPTLADLFAFADAYAGELGTRAGKSVAQQAVARRVRFDLELKRVPFRPEVIGDQFDGRGPGPLEEAVVACIRAAGTVTRTNVRSFDHRSVFALLRLEPGLTGAILVSGTAVLEPGKLARNAGAVVYCPDVEFIDALQVARAHAEGVRVVPWTVNDPEDWRRLLDWGVDGITTDFPDRLGAFLRGQGIAF